MDQITIKAFTELGAIRLDGAARALLPEMESILGALPSDEAGLRLFGVPGLAPLLAANGALGSIASDVLGPQVKAVRALLFNKTASTNWSLAWHQDRTICVRERREVDAFGPWTTKQGQVHVAPPFELLARMATLRIHLDDVPENNAPLLIAPGSHLLGKVPVDEVDEAVSRCGTMACLATAGDVWLYSTPILHASKAASPPQRRRVLQVDFSAEDLPGGLAWCGA